MARTNKALTTGLPGLDQVLKGLLWGDNIVWRADSIEDYLAFVRPYGEAARAELLRSGNVQDDRAVCWDKRLQGERKPEP